MINKNDIVFQNLMTVPNMNVEVHGLNDNDFFQNKNYSKVFGIDGGEDVSPRITWRNVPKGTKSFVITMYDPDAPTQSGFWHWAIKDIPINVNELAENAGAAPSIGDAPHPYHITVTALDTEVLDISPESTPAFMNFNMIGHELARGYKTVYAQI